MEALPTHFKLHRRLYSYRHRRLSQPICTGRAQEYRYNHCRVFRTFTLGRVSGIRLWRIIRKEILRKVVSRLCIDFHIEVCNIIVSKKDITSH